jgi:hypothetical protein
MNGQPINVVHNGIYVSKQNPFPVTASFGGTVTDAFGRLRISQPLTLFDSFHRYQDNGKLNEYTSGSANSVHDQSSCSIVMNVGTNDGDKIYRETSRVFAYQPGKSLLVFCTFCMGPTKNSLRQRIGYFDVDNGIYIQLYGSTLSFVRRSSTSGSIKETVVSQSDWNNDTMLGDGTSGITLDITKTQILFMDIEWLGVGSVRIGFVINGVFCLCHTFHHANQPSTINSDTTLPYMTTACLPVRAELENTGPTSSNSSFRLICTSVISEGGYELRGRQRSVGYTDLDVAKVLPLKNTVYSVISIRLKSNRLGAIVLPTQISLISTVTSGYKWALISNATISGGGSWLSAGSDSNVEYKLDSTNAITDGVVLKSGYFTASGGSSPTINLDANLFRFQLERNTFTNTAYTFTLGVSSDGANNKVLGSIDWEELT